jgi:rSAM/selenodomain-associated transferase 2
MPTNDAPEISVVIPVANEVTALPDCLARISRHSSEILVVDAASDDQSAALARAAGCHVVPTPQRHRARQMNLGAAQARGRILLFLHADTWLPPDALAKIIDTIDRRRALGGGFARRYRSRSFTLAMTSRLADIRNRLWGWHLGDQAIFVRRDIFDRLCGYRDIPIFEDLDFSRRLRALGKTMTLMPPAYSSARRFAEKGPLRTTWDDLRLTRRYLSGVDPNELCLSGVHRIKDLQTYERLS